MSICQECGSEVAEQDLFCPYCGISLRPVTVPADDNVAMESTIVMQAPLPEILADALPPSEDADREQAISASPAATASEQVEEGASEPAMPETTPETTKDSESVETVSASPVGDDDDVSSADEEESAIAPAEETVEGSESEQAREALVIEEIDAGPIAAVDEPSAETAGQIAADTPAIDEPEPEAEMQAAIEPEDAVDAPPADDEIPDALIGDGPATADDTENETQPEVPKYPFSLVESDVVIQTEVESIESVGTGGSVGTDEAIEEGRESETRLEEADVEMSAPVSLADEAGAPAQPDISSGEIAAADKNSFTSPNLESNTDGKRSGLKPLSEGTLLNGRYKIVKKIGGGGMGAVYLAVDQNLGGTQRAVKEMVQSHIEEEQQAKAIEDFKRESMILSTLDHPSIPTIYDYFYDESESRFYLVMKYISGGDLAGRLRAAPEGRIDERTVTEWAVQVIDVLHYLHSLPTTIVYRDLKPSNVMIDGNTGRIMLIDFGIARSINQTQEKGVTAVGTMGYAPPELFSGQVEPRSDIYSLGSTMFHLLTGADPQNNPLLIFDFQKNPRPRQINPRLSDQIERILMRAVEYNADARFSSALEMKLALQQHLDDLSAGRVSYGLTEAPAAISLAYQNVFCGFCGQRIVATDLFCAFCGSKQPLAQHGVHSEIYGARSSATARLVIEGTSQLEMPAYMLDKNENLIGRRDPTSNIFPEVDLSKFDPQTKISRRHARVWRDGSSFLIEDLGSSNGTILLSTVSDTLRLTPHQAHPLANGDRIRVGDTTLHFVIS
ncbi:MAG: protein kinase [Pyrinomonadaceae bacterium]|nr:protein kinase [Pyrinomonadaceae bacterium]